MGGVVGDGLFLKIISVYSGATYSRYEHEKHNEAGSTYFVLKIHNSIPHEIR